MKYIIGNNYNENLKTLNPGDSDYVQKFYKCFKFQILNRSKTLQGWKL